MLTATQSVVFRRFPPSASRNGSSNNPPSRVSVPRPLRHAVLMRTGPWLPGPEPITVDRPEMPGYGIAPADGGEGLLPWTWAVERIDAARNYWVATSSPDGVPHLAAVWGVWVGGALYFSTGSQTVKARNLEASARCVVSTEDADEAVVIHGVAERVGDRAAVDCVRKMYVEKYADEFPDPREEPLFAVAPRTVVGTISDPARFAATATRWHFTSID